MRRMNIVLTDRQKKSLDDLATALDCCASEVIRKALALMQVVVREAKAGNELAVTKDGKVAKMIVGIWSGLESEHGNEND